VQKELLVFISDLPVVKSSNKLKRDICGSELCGTSSNFYYVLNMLALSLGHANLEDY